MNRDRRRWVDIPVPTHESEHSDLMGVSYGVEQFTERLARSNPRGSSYPVPAEQPAGRPEGRIRNPGIDLCVDELPINICEVDSVHDSGDQVGLGHPGGAESAVQECA
jgi:hypothetical protein